MVSCQHRHLWIRMKVLVLLRGAGLEREDALSWWWAQLPGPLSHTPWGTWILGLHLPVQRSIPVLHGPNIQPWLRVNGPLVVSPFGRVIIPTVTTRRLSSLPWTISGDVPCLSDHSSPPPCSPAQEGWGGTIAPRSSDCCSLLLKWNILQGLCSILIPIVSYLAFIINSTFASSSKYLFFPSYIILSPTLPVSSISLFISLCLIFPPSPFLPSLFSLSLFFLFLTVFFHSISFLLLP